MWLTLSLSGGFPVAIHDVTVSFLILRICTRKTIYRALLGAAAPYIDNWLSGNAPWFLQQIDLHTLKFYTLGVIKSICKCAFSLEVIERVCQWSVDGIWLGLKCLVAFKHSSPDMVIKRIKVWWVWWPFIIIIQVLPKKIPVKIVIFIVIVLHGSVVV